jgi:hypothetical protein
VDAGIPQAEERGQDKYARVASISTFYRACTSAFEHPPAINRGTGPTTHASVHRVRAKGCAQQLSNRFGTGAVFPHRGPRLAGVPVLLQHGLQLARYTVQLLSGSEKMRCSTQPICVRAAAVNSLAFIDLPVYQT